MSLIFSPLQPYFMAFKNKRLHGFIYTLDLAALNGFLVFLDFASNSVGHSFWYSDEFLVKLCDIYCLAWPEHSKALDGRILNLISIFSLSPTESAKHLLPVPFYKLHNRYLRNPSFIKYHSIPIALLTIAIKNNENLWSRTLGSTLARAADVIAESLPVFPNLKVTTRKKYSDGDIDLALYDSTSGHMFVIEVKTVYDKHRVDHLIHRFEKSKVNMPKAAAQLRDTKRAFDNKTITIKNIFGNKALPPKEIHFALLTWLDPIDLTIGSEFEDIFSLNFSLLRFLIDKSSGNLELMATTIHELRNIWLMAKERPLDLGQPELTSYLEVQVNLIDNLDDLFELSISPLTKSLLENLPSISNTDDEYTYISYINDTRKKLNLV